MSYYRSYGTSDESYAFINELEVSTRTARILMNLDVKSLEELDALTREKVTATKGAGSRTWKEIRDMQASEAMTPKEFAAAYELDATFYVQQVNMIMASLSRVSDDHFLRLIDGELVLCKVVR